MASRSDVAVIAVVGDGMAGTPGIAARVFVALARSGLNVIAIAQGSSERNISFVVRADQAKEAARRIHDAFQLDKIGGGRSQEASHTDVVLLGFGRVGRALVGATLSAKGGDVRVVGLLDRSGYVFDPRGLSRAPPARLAEGKDQGELLSALGGVASSADDALAFVASHAVSRPALVDVTAEETGDLLSAALGRGFDLVLANKKPLAGPYQSHAALLAAADASQRRIRYEATVGAGLPILDTLPQARGERRPRDPHRGLPLGHARVRAVRRLGGPRVLGGGARGDGARLHRARSARRPVRPRRRPQGAHPRAGCSAIAARPRRPRT